MVDETTGEVLDGHGEPAHEWPDKWDDVRISYRRSKEIAELFKALCTAQGVFGKAEKAGENPHFHSRYPTLEAVIDATIKGRVENGLVVIQMPINVEHDIGVTTLLGHISGQWIESTLWVTPGKLDAQGAGSVITYLRRYALMAILGIAAEDDDGEAAAKRDGASSHERPAAAPQAPPLTAPATADQKRALWTAIVRAHSDHKDHAEMWLDRECGLFKPPINKRDMTVAHFRTLMEKIQEFVRSEGPQADPPADEPPDEFGFDEVDPLTAQQAREEALRESNRRETEERERDKKRKHKEK